MKKRKQITGAGMLVIYALAIYASVSCVVFQFRHPWMTATERLLHIPVAVCWGTVDYAELRAAGGHRR